MKLYRVRLERGGVSKDLYVVASNLAEVEKAVEAHREKHSYSSFVEIARVDFVSEDVVMWGGR